jgi:hypothetical protein
MIRLGWLNKINLRSSIIIHYKLNVSSMLDWKIKLLLLAKNGFCTRNGEQTTVLLFSLKLNPSASHH